LLRHSFSIDGTIGELPIDLHFYVLRFDEFGPNQPKASLKQIRELCAHASKRIASLRDIDTIGAI